VLKERAYGTCHVLKDCAKSNQLSMSDDDLLSLLLKIIGIGIGLLVLFAGFAYNTKPQAAYYLAAAVLLLAFIDVELYWVHQNHHRWELGGIFLTWAVACLAFCLTAAIYCAWAEHQLIETENHGWLIPGNTFPDKSSICSAPEDALVVMFGSYGTWSEASIFSALTIEGCAKINIERTDKGIAVSTDVFAEDGKIVAHIDHNEFQLVSGEHSWTERSDDRSSLVVADSYGKPVLSVRYLNPHLMEIDEVLYCPDGKYVVGFNDGIRGPDGSEFNDFCTGGPGNQGIFIAP
jgi:hypothetical protein